MKFLKMPVFAAVTAALMVLVLAATASATTLTGSGGSTLGSGTELKAENEGTLTLHPPIGDIECKKSSLGGKTTNAGGAGVEVEASIESLSFSECNATVTVLAKGSLKIKGTSGNNGSLTSSGNEVTVEFAGFHCIFKTSSTTLGTLTGSATTSSNATLDISATIPRTGGRSGAFCGSTASWTGSYKFTAPSTLNIDGEGGGGGKTSTTLTTSLSGESKSGEEITVNEGSKVKDTATLSGTNASKATGTVKYKVYADKECKELVTSAGEVTVSSGSVPASEEKMLEAGRVYYWQAEYSGDSSNEASKSTCGKEVLTVKAATSISTSLSGEAKSGEEITVNEGSKVKDTATLSGTRASSATGKVKFKAYKDKECKELASETGEGSLSEGKATSEEKALEAGAVYYWQAEYPGDSLHQGSMGTCGKEVLTVKAATSISTTLSAEEEEKSIEGAEITVFEGTPVKGTGTLSGTRYASAIGTVKYGIYADEECKELVIEPGEAAVEEGSVGSSSEVELEAGTYYWQATYEGDSLHQVSTSTCGEAVQVVNVPRFRAEIPGIFVKGGPATLGLHKFFTGQNTITCNKATLTSINFVPPINSVVVSPQYDECTWGFNLPATVKTNQCRYAITARGQFNIQECNAKIELLIYANAAEHMADTPLCKYKIGNQAIGGRKVTFVNAGMMAGRDINFRFEVKGMAVEKAEGLNMQCGQSGNIGTYEGTTTMKAFDSAPPYAQVGWWRG